MKESYLAWLVCGTLEAVDGYWQVKQNIAWAVAVAKTWVWEKFDVAVKKDF